jgi:hypothetical protein
MATEMQAEAAFTQLCHQLSLSRTGKVQGAVDSLVLTVLAIDPEAGRGDANEVAQALSTYFSIELPVGEVRKALETHLGAGRLQSVRGGGGFRLSPAAQADVESRVDEASKLEDAVRREWALEVAVAHTGLDETALWKSLRAYLAAVFRQNGALAVELLRPGSDDAAGTGNGLPKLLKAALKAHGLEGSPEAASAVNLFFRSSTPARTRYVSQLLDGTFTFFALSVSDATAEFLRGQLPGTRLFLDTNVVLGILQLHENPLQEATHELLAFLKQHKLPYQLYYHERTLKELRELIDSASNRLLGAARFTPDLSRAVTRWAEHTTKLTGIERRYHALNAEQPLDPKVFLSKFQHIEDLLGDKGVKLYRESAPDLDVLVKGEYVAEFEHFLKTRKRERPYMARDHDVVLWMSLQRQRQRASNALRTGALLLTNDYMLFDFDAKFLRRQDISHLPTAVLPQQLIQVLRPLVGTSADFDTRFVEVFAAPEFRTAQSDYDETASMVVSYLATYEDVSTETAVRVLSDEVLLSKLRPDEQTESEFRDLIEGAVFRDNERLLASREAEQRRADAAEVARLELEKAVGNSAEQALAAEGAAERLREERDGTAARARRAEEAGAARTADLQMKLESESARALKAEADLAASQVRAARNLRIARFVFAALLAVAGVLGVIFGPEWFGWSAAIHHEKRRQISGLACAAVLGLCWIIVRPKSWQVILPGVVVAALLAAVTLT